jgi:septum formation topological specificity factor MinE
MCFFKKKANDILSHKKHDHRIELLLEKKKNHEYASLYNLSEEKLQLIEKYFKKDLNKDFIESSIVFYASSILFVKKSDDELCFYVDYKKLNVIIKKNKYSISFITKTIA